jgi:quinol-cytochrome oxidoreductase complex cytochrome b subunit
MSALLTWPEGSARLWQRLEGMLDRISPMGCNPLAQAGSLAVVCFLIAIATGIYLYIVLDTSLSGAWSSINGLGAPGRLIRSLHRLAADGFVMLTAVHLLRELTLGHFQRYRRLAWWSGLTLLPLLAIIAIGGFWLNWDQLGQYSAWSSAELLDWLPLGQNAFVRSFGAGSLSDRLFSLLVFIHLGLPLLLLFGLGLHLQRLNRPRLLPAPTMSAGLLAALLLPALLWPLQIHPAAAADTLATSLALDWFVLAIHPASEWLGPALLWSILAGGFLLLCALPWLRRSRISRPLVDPLQCSGCGLCVADCPFDALTLVPASGTGGGRVAWLDPTRCAGCGICVGACPAATPARSRRPLASAIDLSDIRQADLGGPAFGIGALTSAVEAALRSAGAPLWLAFSCAHASVPSQLPANLRHWQLPCLGMLPAGLLDLACAQASGVVLLGCGSDSCEYRLGRLWTDQRLAAARPPRSHRSPDIAPPLQLDPAAADEAAVLDQLRRWMDRSLPTEPGI